LSFQPFETGSTLGAARVATPAAIAVSLYSMAGGSAPGMDSPGFPLISDCDFGKHVGPRIPRGRAMAGLFERVRFALSNPSVLHRRALVLCPISAVVGHDVSGLSLGVLCPSSAARFTHANDE
jgi:hypothetical protein